MLIRPHSRDDRGAVAIIVALLFALLALPMLTFVVDVGGLYVERRQLQHSADAGAMAVALSCATSCTADSSMTLADSYADGNATRGADLDDDTPVPVCGTVTGLPACDSPSADPEASPYDCEAPPPAGMQYVQVRVDSAGAGWRHFLSDEDTDVSACARVRTDAPLASLSGGFPITMSICEWNMATLNGTNYAPPPPYDPFPAPVFPDPAYEKLIGLQKGSATSAASDTSGIAGCDRGPSGAYVPGGFGWLEGPLCTAEVDDGTADGGEGASEAPACAAELDRLWRAREPIFIPVHDTPSGTGGGEFPITGYAAFVLTGYRLPGGGSPHRSWLTNQMPDCSTVGGSGWCITGFFTEALRTTPGDSTGTGPSFGATTVMRIP